MHSNQKGNNPLGIIEYSGEVGFLEEDSKIKRGQYQD